MQNYRSANFGAETSTGPDVSTSLTKMSDVRVPFGLLLTDTVGTTAKVVWMILTMDAPSGSERVFATRVANRAGLARSTVWRAMAQLAESPWGAVGRWTRGQATDIRRRPGHARISADDEHSSKHARIPAELVTDATIDADARVMFGILQAIPGFHRPKGSTTYAKLAKMVGRDPRTVAKAIKQLVEARWLEVHQANQKASIHFALRHALLAASEEMLPKVRRRLERAPFTGEALMREYLTLIIDSDQFEDDAAPGFLVNPVTDEHLEFDRFYPPSLAFEFNGPQHYGPTQQFSAEYVAKQRARDLIKTGICATLGITLVVIHPEDLTLDTMRRKITRLPLQQLRLPLRDLHWQQPVIDYLETVSRRYRRAARRTAWPS